ncbi:MAG: hypothetical protein D6730_13915 [Bacteroidetes bacterium]|nr:MAG: hypothetical protein D6730_13915 [Bacteroidota bacterium]
MKKIFALLFALVIISSIQAQESIDMPTPANWNSPLSIFKTSLLKKEGISMIRMQSVGTAALRGGGAYPYREAKIYELDQEGRLHRSLEIENDDTVRITTYLYTESGVKNWELIDDLSWNKSYKIGYRFDSDMNVYQVKSYEMINEQDAMLLHTRNYVYNPNGKLQAIRFIERDRLVKLRTYAYDREGHTTGIFEVDANNTPLQSTMYSYNNRGQLVLVSHQNTEEGSQQEYRYLYGQSGKLEQIEWKENGILKGVANYFYDENQRLIGMETRMNPQQNEFKHKLETVIAYTPADYY